MNSSEPAAPQADPRGFSRPWRILIVEHSPLDAELIVRTLKNTEHEIRADVVQTPDEFAEHLQARDYDVILSDYQLPDWNGLEALALLRQLGKDVPFLLVTGTLGDEAAVECVKKGVTEYVLKDRLARLPVAVKRALEEKTLREEHARAEQALQESEARYRELVRNATYGIYRVSPEGKILEANPALVAMLGYGSEAEVLALDIATDVYRHPTVGAQLLKEPLEPGPVEDREVEWKRRDGSLVLVRQSGRVAKDALGHVTHIEGIAEDVTERRALERQLRHVRKLEAIGLSAGSIAHDLNNVIGVILGWAGLGAEQTPAEVPLHHHFAKIKEQAERAAGLTRELLTFARRQMLEPQDISLNQTVAELLSLLEKLIGKDIELKTVLAPNLDLIRVDPAQMEQVLMNLCLNARDAMPRGGRLLIETQNREIDEKYCRDHVDAHPGRYVLLSVTDNGEGMDAATQEHIFEPFFTTKEPGRGTGLGLATVFGVVKQHRGFLQVHSEPGCGSMFCVHLPASGEAPEKGDQKAEPATQVVRGGTETVLVAEDHDGLREMARATLEDLGYRVILAADGEEAIRMFEAHRDRIGLVLLDLVLPKLGGREVYARICATRPGARVLFTTGNGAEVASLGAMVEKGMAVLQEPYNPALLRCKVREVLDRAAQPCG